MSKIFISYRREDTAAIVGRIGDRLRAHFGDSDIFLDIDNVPLAVDIRDHIRDVITQCDVVLSIIGDRWLLESESGEKRLDDPSDFVRIELEISLNNKIPIIPVTVGNAPFPKPGQLPVSLESFAYRAAARVDTGQDFDVHIARLVKSIEEILRPDDFSHNKDTSWYWDAAQ